MTWIGNDRIPSGAATGRLKTTYDRIAGPGGQIDNILAAHSQCARTRSTATCALYKNVLHHTGNSLPLSLLETVGVG